MLIPFPIACFVLALVSDLAFWKTTNDFWASASLWLLGVGLIMAALAVVMGLIDVLGDVQIRNLSDAWLHAGGNIIAVVIELYNWYSRYEHGPRYRPDRPDIVARCSSDLALHRLEGLGNGLSSSRWRDRPGALRSLWVWPVFIPHWLSLKIRTARPRQYFCTSCVRNRTDGWNRNLISGVSGGWRIPP
jgi:hypothetical protein